MVWRYSWAASRRSGPGSGSYGGGSTSVGSTDPMFPSHPISEARRLMLRINGS